MVLDAGAASVIPRTGGLGRRACAAAVSLLPHSVPGDVSERIGRAVARTRLTPNALTVLGLAGMGAAAALIALGWLWQGGVVLLAASLLDLLDGAVARATGRASDWGGVFDAVSDRLADFAILFAVIVWYSGGRGGDAPPDREIILLAAAALSGGMLVSYIRSKAAEFGVQIRSGLGTRAERIILMAAAVILGGAFGDAWLAAVLWLLAALANLTALQRWYLAWAALRERDRRTDEPDKPETPFS